MAYSVFELSVESGRPVELYIITIGATVYRYTSAEDTVTYSANDYLSRRIDRTSPTMSSSEGGRQQMEITIPTDDPVAARYIGIVPAERVDIEIIRFHRTDSPNGSVQWNGRIISAKFEQQGALCRLYSISSESALSRPIPGRKYQGLCNHKLFDDGCKIVKSSNKYVGTVLTVSGQDITVSGVGGQGADWAVGGIVEYSGDSRLVVAQNSNVLTLQLPFRENVLNQSVDVFAGCAHTLAICNTKFSNTINFGGFPYVPTDNPFHTGLD